MEYVGTRGFLQILANYQTTEPDRPKPAVAVSTETSCQTSDKEIKRWWHKPPSQLSPPRSYVTVSDLLQEDEASIDTVQIWSSRARTASENLLAKTVLGGGNVEKPKSKAGRNTHAESSPLKGALTPPDCPICIQPLMAKVEVLATACGCAISQFR